MIRIMKTLLVLLPLIIAPAAFAGTVILNFNEFGTAAPIDATSVSGVGVTFLFSGGTAIYNDSVGGGTILVSDPALTGPTSGTLTLNFDYSTPILAFDIAMASGESITRAYMVTIGTDSYSGDTAPQPDGVISEGHFSYSGSTPIPSAVITFDSIDAPAFALDNLTFDPLDSNQTVTPEPGTILIGAALMALGAVAKRRH
jgi:hypothetical protein